MTRPPRASIPVRALWRDHCAARGVARRGQQRRSPVRFVTIAGHPTGRVRAALAVSLLIVSTLVAGILPRFADHARWLPGPVALAQDLTPVTVALDWYPNANHAGLYLAQERGYFAEAGLAVEL
ncbi:MAG: ABC transporter substrate-binding protein, partial [Chloroflexia bacterium]|nr:ABC transporter substrate-binding protein [Chloroflexia bacterium]